MLETLDYTQNYTRAFKQTLIIFHIVNKLAIFAVVSGYLKLLHLLVVVTTLAYTRVQIVCLRKLIYQVNCVLYASVHSYGARNGKKYGRMSSTARHCVGVKSDTFGMRFNYALLLLFQRYT